MKIKSLNRTLAIMMSVIMGASLVGCGNAPIVYEEAQTDVSVSETEEEDQLSVLMNRSAGYNPDLSGEDKIETVYVTSDANGATREIIVSDWLKNPEGSATLTDTTDLKDIVNVKGRETYSLDDNGNITWDAEGADIYYQGHSESELPVNVKISYTLDGQPVEPSELAGKSGNVTIRFDYTNNSTQKINVNDKEYDVYTPFAVISGLMLDSDKFTNVSVDNGKVISDANNYIVMGLALPGFKDSLSLGDGDLEDLDIDPEDVNIPDHFEISAYTTDFELGMTMTMASSDIVSSLGLSELSDGDAVDKIKSDMEELNDGSNKLVDGAGELKDGTAKLKDGAKELNDGTKELYDGSRDLKDGAGKLADGAGELHDGAKSLYDGTRELNDGAKTLYDGSRELKDGAKELTDGTKTLYDGTGTLASGVKDYTDGASKINDGAKTLSGGIEQVKNGSAALKKGFNDNDIAGSSKALADGAGQVSDGVNALIAQLGALSSGADQLAQLNRVAADMGVIYSVMDGVENGSVPASAFKAGVLGTGADSEEGFNAVLSQYLGTDLDSLASLVGGYAQYKAAYGSLGSAALTGSLPAMMKDMVLSESGVYEMPVYGSEADPAEQGTLIRGEITRDEEPVSEQDTNEDQGSEGSMTEASETGTGESWSDDTQTSSAGAKESTIEGSPDGDVQDTDTVSADTDAAEETAEGSTAEPDQTDKDEAAETKVIEKVVVEKLGMTDTEKATANGYIGIDEKFQTVKATCGAVYTVLSQMSSMLSPLSSLASPETQAQLSALQSGAAAVASGSTALAGGLAEIGNGINSLDAGIGQLSTGANELYAGTGALVSNNSKLVNGVNDLRDGAGKLYDGAGTLYEGTGKLYDGAGSLYEGTGRLYDGAGSLYSGSGELYNGAGDLRDGTAKLYDGAGKLYDGTTELYNGTVDLDAGVVELKDGVIKLDEEGIKKIYDAFDRDLGDYFDRLEAIREAGENYSSFSGVSDDHSSSVKFIIKTDGVKL